MSDSLNFLPIIARVSNWPNDFISIGDSTDYFSRVAINGLSVARNDSSYSFTYSLYVRDLRTGEVDKGFSFSIFPGFEAFIDITNSSETFDIRFTRDAVGGSIDFDTLPVKFLFPLSELLIPVARVNSSSNEWIEYSDKRLEMIGKLGATIRFEDSGTEFEMKQSDLVFGIEGLEPITDPSNIGFKLGLTGIIFSNINLSLDLSANAKQVVILDSALIEFPEAFPIEGASVYDAFFDKNGFSGMLNIEANANAKLFGLDFSLNESSIEFKQNTIVACSIAGTLDIPFFETLVEIEINLSNEGNFLVSTHSEIKIEKQFYTLIISSLSLGRDINEYYVELFGTLSIDAVDSVNLPEIQIDGLRIYTDGSISVEGGSILLEQQEIIDLFGFQMEIDSVGFGCEVDKIFASFSGGVKLTEDLPIGVSANGLRYWFNEHKISFDGIGVSFEIANALSFSGYVDLNLGDEQFTGDILLKLLSINLAVDARLIIGEQTETIDGKDETFKYFYIELNAELPLGLPLGATGLGLYGFSGKVASNMEPTHSDNDDFNWYEDWYKVDEPWNPKYGGFGMGVGTTIGTIFDNGFTCSTKISFMIVFPGPVIMLQGVGNILRKRSALPDNSLFTSLVVFDGNAKTLLAVLELDYLLPNGMSNDGIILDTGGTAEGLFDFDNMNNWHIYLGEEDEDKRIKAEILDHVFKAKSFLMLDPDWLRAGAYFGFDKKYEFDIGKVYFSAYIYGKAGVSWAPQQLEGELGFDGEVGLSVCNVDFGISVDASVGGEIPTPQRFYINYKIIVKLPSPFKDIEIEKELSWEKEDDPIPVDNIIQEAHVCDYKTTNSRSLTLQSDSNELNDKEDYYQDKNGVGIVVPLDSRPEIIFDRNLWDENNYGTPSPLQRYETVGETIFSYKLENCKLQKWDSEKWGDEISINGSWQNAGGTELEIKGDGPFSFTKQTITSSSEEEVKPIMPSYVDSFLSNYSPLQFPSYLNDLESVSFLEYTSYTNLGPKTEIEGVKLYGFNNLKTSDLILSQFFYQSLYLYGIELTKEKLIYDKKANTTNRISIEFPDPAYLYVILLYTEKGCKYKGTVTLANGATKSIALTTAVDGLITLNLKYQNVKNVSITVVENTCHLFFIGFSYEYYRLSQEASRICSESRFIFDPNSDYRITVGTNTYQNTELLSEYPETQYAFFRTEGPPEDLSSYINKIVFSNNGNPHYCLYDLIIYFNENYVSNMYDGLLEVQVYDQNGLKLTDTTETTAGKDEVSRSYYLDVWYESIKEVVDYIECESENAANDMIQARPIIPLPTNQLLEVHLEFEGLKLWTYSFITSRYNDFESLVKDFRGEPWSGALSETASLNVSDSELFETVYYEKLLISASNLPEQPELILLKSKTGEIKFVLMNFPEPLDWDRIKDTFSIEELKDLGNGTFERKSTIGYSTICSTDHCRFIIFQEGATEVKTWAEGSYRFSFEYDLKKEGLPELSKAKSITELGTEIEKEYASVIFKF